MRRKVDEGCALLGEPGGSIDLDEVLARTLDAAGALRGVDAALVSVAAGDNAPIVRGARALRGGGTPPRPSAGPPDGRQDLRAARSPTSTRPDRSRARRTRSTPASPCPCAPAQERARTGTSRSSRSDSPRNGSRTSDLLALEEPAQRAAPAIENARRFQEARQQADLDALTGLHNRRYFHETLARETVRAHRYARKLALIVFDLDDFKEVNDRIGHLAGDAVLAEAAARMREVVRTADVPCRVGGDEFAVIMPESALTDADQLYSRLRAAVAARPIGQAGTICISPPASAELRGSEDDPTALFERGDRALYRAKAAGKGQHVLRRHRLQLPAPGRREVAAGAPASRRRNGRYVTRSTESTCGSLSCAQTVRSRSAVSRLPIHVS